MVLVNKGACPCAMLTVLKKMFFKPLHSFVYLGYTMQHAIPNPSPKTVANARIYGVLVCGRCLCLSIVSLRSMLQLTVHPKANLTLQQLKNFRDVITSCILISSGHPLNLIGVHQWYVLQGKLMSLTRGSRIVRDWFIYKRTNQTQ